MSTAAVGIGPVQHCSTVKVMQHTDVTPSRKIRTSTDILLEHLQSVNTIGEKNTDDIVTSTVKESASTDKDSKKKTFNFKQTAKNVVSGITRKKKGLGDDRSKSSEEIRTKTGDETGQNKGKMKNLSLNKMLPHFSSPGNKFNKMWASLNKTFSNTGVSSYVEVGECRSTMTLGRFFGKKKTEMPPETGDHKSHTLGRMFTFKTPPKGQKLPQNLECDGQS